MDLCRSAVELHEFCVRFLLQVHGMLEDLAEASRPFQASSNLLFESSLRVVTVLKGEKKFRVTERLTDQGVVCS